MANKKATKKRPLRPGQGALAQVLTRMIKPAVAYDDAKQKSEVVIVNCYEDKKRNIVTCSI